MNLLVFFGSRSRSFMITLIVVLLGATIYLDYITGADATVSFFYLIPIAFASWYIGRSTGIIVSLVGLLGILALSVIDQPSSAPQVFLWNTVMTACFFIAFAFVFSLLKQRLEIEKTLARIDPLTDAYNTRFFNEMAVVELDRAARYGHAFSACYIDIDDFKAVNDSLGHTAGDNMLKTIVAYMKKDMRSFDILARLGGDEFFLLLPETNEENAHAIVDRIQMMLKDILRANGWPLTFSIGMATFTYPPATIDDLVRVADELMYKAKSSGKNKSMYRVYHEADILALNKARFVSASTDD
jgi:diguanylate cyclase (GGDEF)-like protein